jgi:hypothetical protein
MRLLNKPIKILFLIMPTILVIVGFSVGRSVSAADQLKSTDYFVGTSATAVSSATDFPFNLYIGDNLTGVTDPIKSAYFTISGVYTGGGSLQAQIDSSATTSKTFILPSVSVPTSFELIYRDDTARINPQSAGSYNYTLNLSPGGITISGLGAKLETTYRYHPPSCGLNYPPYGDLISAIFDSTASAAGPAYNSILWRGALGGASFDTGKVLLQLAASDSSLGPWTYLGSSCLGGNNDWYDLSLTPGLPTEIGCYPLLNNKRYFRYKARLCSSDCLASGLSTPQVDEIIVNWSP